MMKEVFFFSNLVFVPTKFYEKIKKTAQVQTGDILINKDGAKTGKLSLVKDDFPHDPACVNEHVFRLRADESKLRQEFLFHFLYSPLGQRQISILIQGSAQPGLNQRFPKYLQVPVPSPPEQIAIARILSAADDAITQAQQAIARAQRLKRGLLQKYFLPGQGNTEPLANYVEEISYGTSRAANDKRWGYPTLRIPNVIGSEINQEDLTHVEMSKKEASRYELRDNDLLLVRTNGNPQYIGRSAIFAALNEETWLYASYLIRIRFKETISPRFVNEFFNSSVGRRQIFRKVTTSAGNYNINTKSILSIPVPTLSEQRQKEVVEIADAANVLVCASTCRLKQLQILKRGLMQDLLTGRVRVQPQSELL